MSAENPSQPNFTILPSNLPVDEFVFKFGPEVCNLKPTKPRALRVTPEDMQSGCDYCYVFHDFDPDVKPAVMDSKTIVRYAERIAEHADAHKFSVVRTIMHGGEALLYPKKIDEAITALRGLLNCKLGVSLQTNGTIDITKHLPMLLKHNKSDGVKVSVGVSIDGGRAAFNRHRHGRHGEDVYDKVLHTASVLRRSGLPWGIDAVIDRRNNPWEVVEDLAALKPDSISLFPSLIRDPEIENDPNVMPLGQWQVEAYELCRDWARYHKGSKRPFAVPRWDDYEAVFDGCQAEQQNVAGRAWQEMFMHPCSEDPTSAGWGRIDTLAPGARGVHMTAFNPYHHSVDYVLANDPGYIAQRGGRGTLPVECRSCSLVEACGGDYYPHRGNPEKLRELTGQSTPMEFAEAYGDVSPLCADQKIFLPVVARTVEKAMGYPEGLLTGEVKVPDFVDELISSPKTETPVAVQPPAEIPSAYIHAADGTPSRGWEFDDSIKVVRPGYCEPVHAYPPYPHRTPNAPRGLVTADYGREERGMIDSLASRLDSEAIAWLEKGCPWYSSFPIGNTRNPLEEQRLSREQEAQIVAAVRSGELHGRLGVYAYHALQLGGRSSAFHGVSSAPSEGRVEALAHSERHENPHDAIVAALFDQRQPALQNVPFRIEKIGRYWLATGNAARALAAQARHATGKVLIPIRGYGQEPLIKDAVSIKVGFLDLPADMLVLDMPGFTEAETSATFDEIKRTFSTFTNPEQLSLELSARPQPIHLRPLFGLWPSARRSRNWRERPETALIGAAAAERYPVPIS